MDDERIVAYLLGELPEEESERFEDECYFAGEDWPEEVRAAEHDLVDAYLRKELTPKQRQHFEQNYLTSNERQQRVATAAALLRHVSQIPAPTPIEPTWIKSFIAFWGTQRWALRTGLAVGVVAVVVGGLWLARSRTTSPQTFATLTLTIGDINRAEGTQAGRVRLRPNEDGLRIHLKLPAQPTTASRYRVELVNEEGETSPLTMAGRDAESITVEIPAAQLKRGEYAIRLFAVRPDGTEQRVSGVYLFNVE